MRAASSGEMGAQAFSNAAYGASLVGTRDALLLAPLFAALARAALRRVADFNPQDIACTAWALATAAQDSPSLFAALARAALRRVAAFNSQYIASTAFA